MQSAGQRNVLQPQRRLPDNSTKTGDSRAAPASTKGTSMVYAPVIVIGMHRSGTSLVTQTLHSLGLFTGKERDQNHEALFFLKINQRLLSLFGGRWDYPAPVLNLLENQTLSKTVSDEMRRALGSGYLAQFLGRKNARRYRNLQNVDFPWGWKDPRNTFTLPLWLNLFPKAKIIHVLRHGTDAAASLRARSVKEARMALDAVKTRSRGDLFFKPLRNESLTPAPQLASLSKGLSLWEEYTTRAQSHIRDCGDRALEIRYEDFLTRPEEKLKTLAVFCGLNAPQSSLESLAEHIDRSRAFAHVNDPELAEFSRTHANILSRFGY
jgi:hypothetical protein